MYSDAFSCHCIGCVSVSATINISIPTHTDDFESLSQSTDVCLLKGYSPANRTWSPQGFSLLTNSTTNEWMNQSINQSTYTRPINQSIHTSINHSLTHSLTHSPMNQSISHSLTHSISLINQSIDQSISPHINPSKFSRSIDWSICVQVLKGRADTLSSILEIGNFEANV